MEVLCVRYYLPKFLNVESRVSDSEETKLASRWKYCVFVTTYLSSSALRAELAIVKKQSSQADGSTVCSLLLT